jgi:hypothetical protein
MPYVTRVADIELRFDVFSLLDQIPLDSKTTCSREELTFHRCEDDVFQRGTHISELCDECNSYTTRRIATVGPS